MLGNPGMQPAEVKLIAAGVVDQETGAIPTEHLEVDLVAGDHRILRSAIRVPRVRWMVRHKIVVVTWTADLNAQSPSVGSSQRLAESTGRFVLGNPNPFAPTSHR